ncbi:MAG TPA: IS4 family transposase [Polyangiaceae bacterium]
MRAVDILREKLVESLDFMHAKRREALWRVVEGLLKGQELWLTELGRSLPGACSIKHRVKAVDRFIGGSVIQTEISKIYAALASVLLRFTERPVLLIDWTGAESGFYVLSAKIAFAGRALSILSRTYPERKKANPDVEREFLAELKTIIPSRCRPVLVTDAGFLFKWIDSVRAIGWDYVSRVRLKKIVLSIDGRCTRLDQAYKLANRRPRNLGRVSVGKNNPREHRVVLSARPKTGGRYRLGRKGKPLRGGVALVSRDAAREPLLLVTSLSEPPAIVVAVYRLRMQIEQTFRDLKSYRYGWSTRHIRTAHRQRIDVLLLVAALAAVAMHLLGLTIRGGVLARGLQANTERRRNVFSTFFLGRLALHENLEAKLPHRTLRAAIRDLITRLPSVERMPV